MSNSILTNDIITKRCLMALKNNLIFTRNCNREYSKEFAKTGAKVGNQINIRKPTRYTVTTGATLEIQDSQDQSIPLTLDKQFHVGMAFSTVDRTLSIDAFHDRYIDNAMLALANKIDSGFYADMVNAVYQSVGVPSATALPSTLKGFTYAKAKMELAGAPVGTYNALVNPLVQASLVDGNKSLFQSAEKIAEQYESGLMGLAAGCKFASTANVASHTIGALGGTPLVNGATVSGATTIVTDGWSNSITGVLKKGDVFSMANVYAVNPQTRQSTGELAQFLVTADVNSDSSGNVTITIDRAIVSSGQYQNVDSLPVDNSAITIFGSATAYAGIVCPQNLVFHKNAFAMGVADLEMPDEGAKASRAVDEDAGLSLMMTQQYDIVNFRTITRIDFLGGWKCIYPELAARVVGQPA